MRRLTILLTTIALWSAVATAQQVDARAALLASIEAMGADQLETIEYSGGGFSSRIGQQYSVNAGWPTYQVVDYTRSIDFDAGWSREDYTRQQGDYPLFGRTPLGPEPITAIVHGEYWSVESETPIEVGESLQVIEINGLKLKVQRTDRRTATPESEEGTHV